MQGLAHRHRRHPKLRGPGVPPSMIGRLGNRCKRRTDSDYMSKELTPKQLKTQRKQQKQAQRAAAKAHSGTSGSSGVVPTKPASQDGPLSMLDSIESPKDIEFNKEVHPAILHLALQMQSFKIIGSSSRCKAMMHAFEQVVADYVTPEGSTLSRTFALHLSPQIEMLKSSRGLSVSMGNAIRWLKKETSALSIDLSEEEAKAHLIRSIRSFVQDRIDVADHVIVESVAAHIRGDGDVILTYGKSEAVFLTLAEAYRQKKNFRVICADSRPLFEGKKLAARLVALGIPTTYVMITALPYMISEVSLVLVGAHAMVSNGHLYSRVGTSLVAVTARTREIPVLVLCETVKFSDRVQLDTLAFNELIPNSDAIFYDLTDQKFISKVITELGPLPASSVPVILREYNY